ncbi:uncharacterized protein LOC135102092 [Scylla paramamosain]|uniref:uncharacterized protein LOC135102092 n=1 Tax=Scylla paramamosain TaxID=85552 RepID=UPI003082E33F
MRNSTAYTRTAVSREPDRGQPIVCDQGEETDREEREDSQEDTEIQVSQTHMTQELQRDSHTTMFKDSPGDASLLPKTLKRYDTLQEVGQSVDERSGENDRQTKEEEETGSSTNATEKRESLDSGVRDILNAVRFTHLPPPTFSGGSCSDYWVFTQAFEDYVKAASLPYKVTLQLLLTAYFGPLKAALPPSG